MAITTDLESLIPALCGHQSGVVACDEAVEFAAAREFAARLGALSDDQLLAVKDEMIAVNRRWAVMMQSMTGVVAARSSREFGHGGLAAKQGHRSAISMVQEDLGVGKAEAARLVRVAEAVTEVTGAAARPDSATTQAEREAQAAAEADARAEAHARAEGGAWAAGGAGGDDGTAAVTPLTPLRCRGTTRSRSPIVEV